MKHNNVIPNGHFRKEWQLRVRTWFNQPARKYRRRQNRIKRSLRLAPRPTAGALRPVVQCSTVKYNSRARFGKGFTLEELKRAGVSKKDARGVGISVDHRRKNKCEESLRTNAQRLKEYKSKLVLFPLPKKVKKVKKTTKKDDKKKKSTGRTARVAPKSVVQHRGVLLPIAKKSIRTRSRVISATDKTARARAVLQKARADKKLEGTRLRMAQKEKEEEANPKKTKEPKEAKEKKEKKAGGKAGKADE